MSAGAELMTATAVVLTRRPALVWQHPAWDLVAAEGGLLASVTREAGVAVRYVVAAPGGAAVWRLDQHRLGRLSRFAVSDHAGAAVGEVDQENALFSPQFRLVEPQGATIRLDSGGNRNGPWLVQDLAGGLLGSISQRRPQADALPARIFLVQRGDGLGGELWPLALVSAICLDIVKDRK